MLVKRRLAERNRRPPLPAQRLLARGGLHQADVGAAVLLDAASYGLTLAEIPLFVQEIRG